MKSYLSSVSEWSSITDLFYVKVTKVLKNGYVRYEIKESERKLSLREKHLSSHYPLCSKNLSNSEGDEITHVVHVGNVGMSPVLGDEDTVWNENCLWTYYIFVRLFALRIVTKCFKNNFFGNHEYQIKKKRPWDLQKL